MVGDRDDILVEDVLEPKEVFSNVEGPLGLGISIFRHGVRRLVVLIHGVPVDDPWWGWASLLFQKEDAPHNSGGGVCESDELGLCRRFGG